MSTASRTGAVLLLTLASLYGCEAVRTTSAPGAAPVTRLARNAPAATAPPSPYNTAAPTLAAYKAAVAHHVNAHNPAHTFSGRLPPMLPAIVVLNITVDRAGRIMRLEVQRSRDPDASSVALASMERCGTLPSPQRLLAANVTSLTFSETFLFNDAYHFQLRSLAAQP